MADNVFYIYVGHSDPPHGHWKFIPDTPEEHEKAAKDGYTAGTTMSFAYEPQDDKAEPIRRGSLILDFDSKADPAKAIECAREVIKHLQNRYGVNPESLRYWLSGGKGCHIEIPAELYGGDDGDPFLPKIQPLMLQLMDLWYQPLSSIIDRQLYCMGKGKLLRWPNIKRPNDRYKVSVSANEFFDLEYKNLNRLTEQPRTDFDPQTISPEPSQALTRVYELALELLRITTKPGSSVVGLESLLACSFIRHCYRDQTELPEPHWWIMVTIMTKLGDIGRDLIHEFSRGYPDYTATQTDRKIRQAWQNDKPITCEYIRGLFDCGCKCPVRSPADLWRHRKSDEVCQASKFDLRSDGVYFLDDSNERTREVWICSPLKVLGKMRNSEGESWARLVEIKTSDGRNKELSVYMKDMAGRDNVKALLLDNGVEINTAQGINRFLVDYIQSGAPDDTPLLCVEKTGWLEDTYILPDCQFGNELKEKIHFLGERIDILNKCSGSLDDWKDNVGNFCQGNELLVLLTSYALTGPLLKRCQLEGGGIHIFGSSSTGKTTCARVAGSICGGGGQNGFIRQWRTTHNALENTANLHNDNFLILDEIGQATNETVSQVTYMLSNGQGRERMKSDASRRKTHSWLLNFLSTGEITINDKIEEHGKYLALAGQEVRVIDLPIQSGNDQGTFQNLHGLPDSRNFSDMMSRNACRYYGAPLREFLKKFCSDLQTNDKRLEEDMERFVAEVCPPEASGQVKRVARKFSLIAAVGELAVSFGVLPYDEGGPWTAAACWFQVWLTNRNSIGDQEIAKAVSRIEAHFDQYSANRYVNADVGNNQVIGNMYGYRWEKNDLWHYMMFIPVFNELIRGVNRKAIITELDKRGYLAHTGNGRIMETKEINRESMRGIIFIPSAWKGKPEKKAIVRHEPKPQNSEIVF